MHPSTPQDHSEIRKEPEAQALGQRGGQKRMAKLSASERTELAKHAARSRWHPQEARAAKERAAEITYLVREALREQK